MPLVPPRDLTFSVSASRIAQKPNRYFALDALRGFIMVLMALDHANYFITRTHPAEFWGISLPQYHDSLSFFTRWVSHFCAPGFCFLMGTSMVLFAASRCQVGWSQGKIGRFVAIRGILLIVLQHLLETPVWILGTIGGMPDVTEPPGGGEELFFHFGVLYVLGTSMIFWSFLLHASRFTIALISLVAIILTQWLTPGVEDIETLFSLATRLLLIPGRTGVAQVYYPLIPWLGVVGMGILLGKMLLTNQQCTYDSLLSIGAVLSLFFLIVRGLGGFGNFHVPGEGWLSFLHVTKYPPSLSFILLTLGINVFLLAFFSKIESSLKRLGQPLLVFGQAAFFFYIVHLYLYGGIGLFFPGGASLILMYCIWLIGLFLLYPLCRWYIKFKRQKPLESVWRFF